MSHDRSDVERVTVASKLSAHHSRAAGLVEKQAKMSAALAAYFAEVEEVKALLKEQGSLWAGPVLDPPMEAASRALAERGPKETRIELERLGEAPLMPLSDPAGLSERGDRG